MPACEICGLESESGKHWECGRLVSEGQSPAAVREAMRRRVETAVPGDEVDAGRKAVEAAATFRVFVVITVALVTLAFAVNAALQAHDDAATAFGAVVLGGCVVGAPLYYLASCLYWSTKRKQAYLDRH